MTYASHKRIRDAMLALPPGQAVGADFGSVSAAQKAVKTLRYHARAKTTNGRTYRAVLRGTEAYVVRDA